MELSEIEKADIAWFEGETGFCLDIAKQKLAFFVREGRGLAQQAQWVPKIVSFSDLRSWVDMEGVPLEFSRSGGTPHSVQAGAGEVGAALGVSLRNSMEKRSAAKRNGILFQIASTDLPEFHLRVERREDRLRLKEAIRQAVNDGRLEEKIRRIPDQVNWAMYKPTKEQIEEGEKKSAARQKVAHRLIGAFTVLVLLGALGMGAFWWYWSAAYKQALLNGEDVRGSKGLRCTMYSSVEMSIAGPPRYKRIASEDLLPLAGKDLGFSRGDFVIAWSEEGKWLVRSKWGSKEEMEISRAQFDGGLVEVVRPMACS